MGEPTGLEHPSRKAETETQVELGNRQSLALSEARGFFVTANLEHLTSEQIIKGLDDIKILQKEAKFRLVEQITRRAVAYMKKELGLNVTKVARTPMHETGHTVFFEKNIDGDTPKESKETTNKRIAKQVELNLKSEFYKIQVFGSDRYGLEITIDWRD
ncbi:MAG: hypothetical protein WAV15_03875 [Minisyncoccia bacterium]